MGQTIAQVLRCAREGSVPCGKAAVNGEKAGRDRQARPLPVVEGADLDAFHGERD
jgi:hypothetical protein